MQSFEEIIQFAICHEESEAAFYEQLANRSNSTDQKNALLAQAAEERDHKRRLEEILANQKLPSSSSNTTKPSPMQFKTYLKPRETQDGLLDYEDALLLSVQQERDAEAFYRELATHVDNPGLKKTILFLAEQEGKHAHQLEKEMDNAIKEN